MRKLGLDKMLAALAVLAGLWILATDPAAAAAPAPAAFVR